MATTQFSGELSFKPELTLEQVNYLETILGEDVRDYPEWKSLIPEYVVFIDLEFTGKGLRWDNSEKTCNMEGILELVLALLHQKWPNIELHGELKAQGDDLGDVYKIRAKGDHITTSYMDWNSF